MMVDPRDKSKAGRKQKWKNAKKKRRNKSVRSETDDYWSPSDEEVDVGSPQHTMGTLNTEPIWKAAAKVDLEVQGQRECQEGESSGHDLDGFVKCRRKKGRKKKSTIDEIYVANLPKNCQKSQLKNVLQRFGSISDVYYNFEKYDTVKFALVRFDSTDSVDEVMRNRNNIFILDENEQEIKLQVEKKLINTKKCTTVPEYSECFLPLVDDFDWNQSMAEYVTQSMRMEDYLVKYVHNLASYRGVDKEELDQLDDMLVKMSKLCPKDKTITMPPHVSGLIYNQEKGQQIVFDSQQRRNSLKTMLSPVKESNHRFTSVAYLERYADLFDLSEYGQVRYLNLCSAEEAAKQLKMGIIEGCFLYFLSKFSHHKEFKIVSAYYERSEPIRTCLRIISGCHSIPIALDVFFKKFGEVFYYNERNLLLKKNFFASENKRKLENLIQQNEKSQPTLDVKISEDEDFANDFESPSYPDIDSVPVTPSFEENGFCVEESDDDQDSHIPTQEEGNIFFPKQLPIPIGHGNYRGLSPLSRDSGISNPLRYDLPHSVISSVNALNMDDDDLDLINARVLDLKLGNLDFRTRILVKDSLEKEAQAALRRILDELP